MVKSNFKDANILIVDDKESNIELLEGLLDNFGYRNIKSTTDPRLVLNLYQSFDPDLIILDLMMPHLSGFEVMEMLNQVIPSGEYMPILVLTSDVSYESRQHALTVGAMDFLTKPFDMNEVSLRIKNLLETRYLHQLLEDQNKNLARKVEERTQDLKKAYQEIIVINKQLEELDKSKLEFLNIISHEIRTPLNGIKGFTGILKNTIDSPQLIEYLHYLDVSVNRLERFLNQALLITELRTNVYKIQWDQIPINEVLELTKFQLQKNLQDKQLKVEFKNDTNQNSFSADLRLLKICFECLLDNAIKFSPTNGVIDIKIYNENSNTVIEFTDKGPGFSALALNNLFSFFSIGNKHVDQNTGLSLALIKLIMDAHKGEISVSNLQTGGATVKLQFRKS